MVATEVERNCAKQFLSNMFLPQPSGPTKMNGSMSMVVNFHFEN